VSDEPQTSAKHYYPVQSATIIDGKPAALLP
jgi:hypothetical protein